MSKVELVGPGPAALKCINFHITKDEADGGKVTLQQHRYFREGEWSVEPTSDFLGRATQVASNIESAGGVVARTTSSSAAADGTELTRVQLATIMNHFRVLDYICAKLLGLAVHTPSAVKDTILVTEVPQAVRDERFKLQVQLTVFDGDWNPSIDGAQALLLMSFFKLDAKRKKNGWEISDAGAHSFFVEDSTIPLEIVRTVVRMHHHSNDILIPTKDLLALLPTTLLQGDKQWSTESF